MPEILVQGTLVQGEPAGEWEIAVEIDGLGRFSIDDNSKVWDPAFANFVPELRDETSRALVSQAERWASVDKGWSRVTPQELAGI
jgi:hypothetical protein